MMGGTFDIEEISIGKKREDPSRARIVVRASPNLLTDILRAIQPHGTSIERELERQGKDATPDGFYPNDPVRLKPHGSTHA